MAAAGAVLAGAFGSCAPAYDVQTLYNQLQSHNIEERQDALETIEKIIREGNYEVFVRGALSPVKSQRAPSILYLSRMMQPKARAALRDLLRVDRRSLIPYNPIRMKPVSEETDSRILVAHLIAENGGDPEAVEALVDGMQGQPPDVLVATCYALGALRDPKGVPFLATAARHEDLEVVRAAAQALGMFSTPQALEALKSLLAHPSQVVRSEVLSALQGQNDPSVVGTLETIAASDPSPELRAAAMGQLGRLKEGAPVPFLIEQLKGKDDTNRQAALDTLRLLSGQPYGPRPEQWSRWWEQNQKSFAPRH
jgi:HEAT repeat protein